MSIKPPHPTSPSTLSPWQPERPGFRQRLGVFIGVFQRPGGNTDRQPRAERGCGRFCSWHDVLVSLSQLQPSKHSPIARQRCTYRCEGAGTHVRGCTRVNMRAHAYYVHACIRAQIHSQVHVPAHVHVNVHTERHSHP